MVDLFNYFSIVKNNLEAKDEKNEIRIQKEKSF